LKEDIFMTDCNVQIKGEIGISGRIIVEIKDGQWRKAEGRLDGLTATSGNVGLLHNRLKLYNLAGLNGWKEPAWRGNSGTGDSEAGRGGQVSWEVLYSEGRNNP
jgi:hypothetical protein